MKIDKYLVAVVLVVGCCVTGYYLTGKVEFAFVGGFIAGVLVFMSAHQGDK
jgi:type IV secretory pathway VirB2 component (pilin)